VLAAGLAVGATLLAALLPAWRLARLDPTEALRGERIGSFALPRWLARATATGPAALTYALRGLVRRPLLSAATVLSIDAAIGLAASLNIIVSSTNAAVDGEFAHQAWSYSADLASLLPVRRAVALARRAGARQVEPVVTGPARLQGPLGRSADVQLVGLPRRPQLLRLQLTAGSLPRAGRIVLSQQTAQALHAALGDRVRLATTTATTRVIVGGIARTLAGEQSYLPSSQAAPLLALAGRATGLLLTSGPPAAAHLRANPLIARVSSKASALQAERDMIAELTGLITLLETISLGVGAVFLISTLALSHLDRRGEFATQRSATAAANSASPSPEKRSPRPPSPPRSRSRSGS
jgi:putative ABC transport system permease protein